MDPSHNNREILQGIGADIATNYGVAPEPEQPSFWSRINSYFPSSATVGETLGKHIVGTHGQQWSNQTVEFVVNKFFAPPKQEWSIWDVFSSVPKQTITEVAKLTVTPKLVPIMTMLAGVGGQVALPLLVNLVGVVYNKVINDPEKRKQFANIELNKLFTIDQETGRLRDAFGRLLTEKDMKDVLSATAQYHLVGKLIQLCNEIDEKTELSAKTPLEIGDDISLEMIQKEDFGKESLLKLQHEIDQLIDQLMKSYYITRTDGQLVFPSGELITAKMQTQIKETIEVLKSLNIKNSKKEIQQLVHLFGEQSLYPLTQLNEKDLEETAHRMDPKRLPAVFEGDNEWKNFIVRGADGVCFLASDVGDKKAGTVIPSEDVKVILNEALQVEKNNQLERFKKCEDLLHEKTYTELVDTLNEWKLQDIRSFLSSQLLRRQFEKGEVLYYLNGQAIEEKDRRALLKKIALLPPNDLIMRKKHLLELVTQFGQHLPKSESEKFVIKSSDGYYFYLMTRELISEEEGEQLLDSLHLASLPREEAVKLAEKRQTEAEEEEQFTLFRNIFEIPGDNVQA